MSIESVYENRTRGASAFNGYGKTEKPPKEKQPKTKFKVGDRVSVLGEDGKEYLRGKVISLVNDMYIEGTIVEYSDSIRYPVGTKDVFLMRRGGKRNLNGTEFTTVKREKK